MKYLIIEFDNEDEYLYKQRYNEQYDIRASEWEADYFGDEEYDEYEQ